MVIVFVLQRTFATGNADGVMPCASRASVVANPIPSEYLNPISLHLRLNPQPWPTIMGDNFTKDFSSRPALRVIAMSRFLSGATAT